MAAGIAFSVSGCILSSPSPFPFRTTRLFSFPRSKDPAAFASVTIRNSAGVSTHPQEDNYPHQPSLQTIVASDNTAAQTYTNTSPNSRRKYGWESEPLSDEGALSLKDYFQQSKQMLRSDGGPPRWFSPLDCASRLQHSPLLLFLPGYVTALILPLFKPFNLFFPNYGL